MRCASPTTIYAYTGSGFARGTYESLTIGADTTSCTSAQLVVMTQAELDQYVASPFRLSVAEGGAISGAILLLWALAFGVRQIVRMLRESDVLPPPPEV